MLKFRIYDTRVANEETLVAEIVKDIEDGVIYDDVLQEQPYAVTNILVRVEPLGEGEWYQHFEHLGCQWIVDSIINYAGILDTREQELERLNTRGTSRKHLKENQDFLKEKLAGHEEEDEETFLPDDYDGGISYRELYEMLLKRIPSLVGKVSDYRPAPGRYCMYLWDFYGNQYKARWYDTVNEFVIVDTAINGNGPFGIVTEGIDVQPTIE